MDLQAVLYFSQVEGFLGQCNQNPDFISGQEKATKIGQANLRSCNVQSAQQVIEILPVGTAVRVKLQQTVQQEPFLIIEFIAGPIVACQFPQFFPSRGKLPGIQVEMHMFQGIETLKAFPAVKNRGSGARCPGPFHKSMEGGMADVCQPGFDSGQDFGRADSFGHLFLGEPCFLSGFSDEIAGIVYSHIVYSSWYFWWLEVVDVAIEIHY